MYSLPTSQKMIRKGLKKMYAIQGRLDWKINKMKMNGKCMYVVLSMYNWV